ncbi:MAG: CsoS2 family carboxysome shell protein, partial [Serpentinimonas sp.]|nr:CsoS2 family carboxysome shell protein [Serpentinimonas sp.]
MPAPASQTKAACTLPNGRTLARARRQTLAQEGKVGIQKVANASRIAATMPDRADWQTALVQGVTGRQLAMQKRIVQSLAGRTEAQHSSGNRSVARSRSRPVAERTEVGHTLSGQEVSGIQVERSSKVTGQEPGTCRNVTGTEYIGMEQYQAWCESKPQPRPPKVGLSQTTGQQQSISGTEVDPQPRVTGNQTGVCLGITGTQYLSDLTTRLCQEQPLQGPHKVSVMSSRGQQTVTGVVVNGGSKVTGNEAGMQRPITGTQYARAVQAAPSRMPASEARHALPEPVQVQRQSASWRTQSLTGDRPGIGGGGVTGDERGACEPITGTPFIGP